jgi:hypothetical protein
MANRYTYQFNASYKPRMMQIEGFVSIGTGGLLNYPDQSGLGVPSGGSVSTGLPRASLPGQATAAVPTGWVGGFSGAIGLYGAGVNSIARVATGAYRIELSDDYVRLDSCQVTPVAAGTGLDCLIVDHTVGLGNSVVTGGATGALAKGFNPKNCIFIQFTSSGSQLTADITPGGGFFVDIRVRDSLVGPQ